MPEPNIMKNIKDYILFFEVVVGHTKPRQERNYYYFVCLWHTKNYGNFGGNLMIGQIHRLVSEEIERPNIFVSTFNEYVTFLVWKGFLFCN